MAALRACVENNPASVARWNQAELLKDAVSRERQYIRTFCGGDNTRALLLERGVMLLTFTGPLSKDDLRWLELLQKDARACGYPLAQPGETSGEVAALLGESKSNAARTMSPMAPDILAEALAVSVLAKSEQTASAALEGAIECSGLLAWANLLRAVTDLYALAEFAILQSWVKGFISRRTAKELALAGDLIPHQTVALADIAVLMGETLLKALPEGPEADEARARLLNNMGGRYSALGQREEALQAAERAADIYKRLAAQKPDAFEPDLAGSLNNLGIRYTDFRRREEALGAAELALEIRERLAARNPEAFEPDLASSLNNLGNCCSALGRREEALRAAQRAREIRERLAARNPDAFEPALATSLNNLGIRYSDLGRREEALGAAGRAVEIRERLAAQNPDAFEPDLAGSLNTLGSFYSDLGRREEALGAAERALEIRERLAAQNPDAFGPDLAMSLGTLGQILSTGEPRRARECFKRGIENLRPLFQQSPQAFVPLMSGLVGEYVRACESTGEEPDAAFLGPIQKALRTVSDAGD